MHIVFSLPSTFPSLIVLLYGNWILGWEKVLQAIKNWSWGKPGNKATPAVSVYKQSQTPKTCCCDHIVQVNMMQNRCLSLKDVGETLFEIRIYTHTPKMLNSASKHDCMRPKGDSWHQ